MAKATSTNVTTRAFRVDPQVIMTLIRHQAGSLEKALMEAISNSMDAGATAIDLTVEAHRVVVQDNGKGLTQRAEIEQFFEVFGFDHEGLGREHGRFGVGRGQLFCYGKNTWRTGKFSMEVDIQNKKNLDYDLEDDLKPVKGMGITIDLYEPLTVSALYRLEDGLRRLVRHAFIPITYNGKLLNELPHEVKWGHETDQAWFNVRQNGNLQIYSQGLLVKEVSSYQYGVGGTLVTKPGQAFELNMARNDILVQTCPVWKAVAKDLRRLAEPYRDKAERQNTLTSEQRKLMALEALTPTGPSGLDDLYDKQLFTLTNGKHLTLNRLLERHIWAAGKTNDQLGDKAIQMQVGYALHPDTLDRFAVRSLADLKERLIQVVTRVQSQLPKVSPAMAKSPWEMRHHRAIADKIKALQAIQPHESTVVFQDLVKVDFKEIPTKDLTEDEKAMLYAVRKGSEGLKHAAHIARQDEGDTTYYCPVPGRTLKVMTSDVVDGCTNGTSLIWIHRKFLKNAAKGLSAFSDLANLVLHEYTHGASSRGDHGHDLAFYEAFHDAVQSGAVMRAAVLMMATYAKSTKRKPSRTLLSSLDTLDMEGAELFQGQRPPLADEHDSPVVEAPVVAAPPPAKRRRTPGR